MIDVVTHVAAGAEIGPSIAKRSVSGTVYTVHVIMFHQV